MKKIILLFLLVLSVIVSPAQWNQVNVGTTTMLHSVNYHSANEIWIGSTNNFMKSLNGGNSWIHFNPPKDNNNISLIPSEFHDFAITGTSTAIATGIFFWGNTEHILTTTNGGYNWDYATTNNTVPLLRYILSVENFGNTVIAVGNNGRMFRSTNSGNNWTLINTGTTNTLNDVKFLNSDTVIVSGNGVMLRSVDDGISWTVISVTDEYFQVSCIENVVYSAPKYTNNLLKSTDYGFTYNVLPLPFSAFGAMHAVSKDTLIVSGTGGLFISNDGGVKWEEFVLSDYKFIRMIDFLNTNEGYAVGNSGYVLKTSNVYSAPTKPIASFTYSGYPYCQDDTLFLTNTTPQLPGYTYQWLLNGALFSTGYSSSVLFTNSGINTITLVAGNSTGYDTVSTNFTVTGHELDPFVMLASEDTICPGNALGFYISNAQNGVSYQLREGYVNIGSAVTGNGGLKTFPVPSISNTTTYNIIAIKINTCFTDSLIEYKTIIYNNTLSGPAQICNLSTMPPCIGTGIFNFTLGTINNNSSIYFSKYFDYSACYQTDLIMGNLYPFSISATSNINVVKVWIDYDNNGIFDLTGELAINSLTGNFIVPTVTVFNQPIRMRVAVSTGGISSTCSFSSLCAEVEDYTVRIIPAPIIPTPAFSFSLFTDCPVKATFTNSSYNATDFVWDFGDGSSTDTSVNPIHNYDSSGTYTVSLIACNPTGCDTLTQQINVAIPTSPPPSCVPTLLNCTIPKVSSLLVSALNIGVPLGNSTNHDFTCIHHLNFIKDSTYQVVVGVTSGYKVTMLCDLGNGVFDGLTTGWGSSSTTGVPLWIKFPMSAPDSVPLRVRILTSTLYSNHPCSTHCGDYKDVTVFLSPPPLNLSFFAAGIAYNTCLVNDSVQVNFINKSQGDTAWLWDFGDGGTSMLEKPIHYYHNIGEYTIKLIAWGPHGQVDSLILPNHVKINPVIPVITFDSGQLSVDSGAVNYQWFLNGNQIGSNQNLIMPASPGVYTVTATYTGGCSATSPPFNYFPVWPGDTDDNNVVTVYDLLPIGLHYSQTGPPRNTIDISWYGFPADNWGIAQASGVDLKHVDCNGDGVIDFNDTTAISTNLNLTHQKINPSANKNVLTDPDIYFVTSNNTYIAGDWVEVDIMVGTASLPVTDLYGLGFDLSFDHILIEQGTAGLDFSNSLLNDVGISGLSISNIDEPIGVASGSVVRINQIGKSGFGKIGTFMFKANSNISTAQSMSFNTINFSAVDPLGNNLNLNAINHNININPLGTTVVQIPDKGFLSVYPNPFSNFINLSYFLRNDSDITIEVFNNLGQNLHIVNHINQPSGNYEVIINEQVNNLKAGIYFLKLTIDGESVVKKIEKIK